MSGVRGKGTFRRLFRSQSQTRLTGCPPPHVRKWLVSVGMQSKRVPARFARKSRLETRRESFSVLERKKLLLSALASRHGRCRNNRPHASAIRGQHDFADSSAAAATVNESSKEERFRIRFCHEVRAVGFVLSFLCLFPPTPLYECGPPAWSSCFFLCDHEVEPLERLWFRFSSIPAWLCLVAGQSGLAGGLFFLFS